MSFSSLEQNWFRWGDDLLFNFADCIDDDKFLCFVWRNRSNIYSKFIEFAKPESIFTCCASARANRRSDTHHWRHAHFQSIEPNFILKKTKKWVCRCDRFTPMFHTLFWPNCVDVCDLESDRNEIEIKELRVKQVTTTSKNSSHALTVF